MDMMIGFFIFSPWIYLCSGYILTGDILAQIIF